MFTLYEATTEVSSLNEQSRSLLEELLASLDLRGTIREIDKDDPVYLDSEQSQKLAFIESGFVRLERNNRIILFLETNELLGWGNHLPGSCALTADSPVVLREFYQEEFFNRIFKEP